ncbi:MAG: hypothetical protein ABMB14_25700 [Myxococcota bacterium]
MPLALLLACAGAPSGADESIRVRDAGFVEGPLPHDDRANPAVSYASSTGFVISRGQAAIDFAGAATDDAWSVGVTFPDAPRSGYWVVPMGGPDPTAPGTLTFSFTVDFGDDVPFGLHPLRLAAIDRHGRGGPTYDATLCVLPEYADGSLAACDDSLAPQDTILALSWDTLVDLDLTVVTPSGKVVNGKAPTTADPEVDPTDPSVGALTRDANGGCVIDGTNLESLVFPGEPAPGDYQVYADLYSACGEPYVNFALDLYQRVDRDDGTFDVDHRFLVGGELLAYRADRGSSLGLYLTTVTFPQPLR